jgi:hypothetical protein
MNKRTSTLVLGTALAVLSGAAVAAVPTTVQYVGDATVFVPGTTVAAPAAADPGSPAIYFRGDATVFRTDVTAPKAPGVGRAAPLGHEASGNASRVIDLAGRRAAINVTAGETVQFNLDGRSVTWTFDTLGTPAFSLAKIVPQAPDLTVYVARNPLETGS